MNCTYVLNRLSPYMDGELSGDEMLRVKTHLQGCARCAKSYDSCVALKHLVSKMPGRQPDPEFEARLLSAMRNLRAETAKADTMAIWPSWRMAVALAAAAVAAFGVLYFRDDPNTGQNNLTASQEIALDQDWNNAASAFPANTLPAGLEGN
ncbi:MAG: zf-HC2 domain-containing protein [Armatimonadetes bacterium]|nr:zf-HC2 domain-containing protein [Armatimonadota bacterium]